MQYAMGGSMLKSNPDIETADQNIYCNPSCEFNGINQILEEQYGFELYSFKKFETGVGSNTYLVSTDKGKYILKNSCQNQINHADIEPDLCIFLHQKGLSVSEFIKNKNNQYICNIHGDIFHLQKYIEGKCYDLNTAPEWLMEESARTLGKIQTVLKDYPRLPIGMGEDFFQYMTPDKALNSYENTLKIAIENNLKRIADDLLYRINLMKRFPLNKINIHNITCGNTHGDYFISQLICNNNVIAAAIDWTAACVHPYVWEIIRSFVYGEPTCKNGEINSSKFITYMDHYLEYGTLTKNDIIMMPQIFYYQIAVCDYYNQYFESTAPNRAIFLHQAEFSTRLMKWFDKNMDELLNKLELYY